ncbi:MAG: NitT/TauT family transport system permease protein [Pseudonocardiales bacterium]|jgi:NitT/TauT family transport system permease protein|nr:NitT/TauT family transport system permease protein [Pseudonocardiales bacterium]MDQ1734752.1 NitT/TauT family transport system permease protein [Pseudonocardiales bacterium]
MAHPTIDKSATPAAEPIPDETRAWETISTSTVWDRVRRLGVLLPLLSVIVFLGIWQVVGGHVDPILLATPINVAKAFWDLLKTGQLGPAFATAMGDLATGYALAAVVGIAIGVLMGRSPIVERVLNPYVNFFQATPLIALVPLVVIWFGVGFEARVTVTFMLAVWSIIINTATGVKETPASLIDVGRVYKLSRWRVVTGVAIPNAVPNIFAGFRIALGKALIGMVIAQMEISVTGLGGLITNYGNAFKTAYLLAAVCTASLVGVIAAAVLELVRRWVFPWTQGEDIGRW